MLAVHALWSPGRGVLLWAEDGDRPVSGSSRALRTARPHPFAVPAAELAALHPGKPTTVTLLLPSRAGGPLASPELVRPGGPGRLLRSAPELRQWSVPALLVDVAELDDPAPDARYGASVAHLRRLADLATDLAGRGRVLPTLHLPPDGDPGSSGTAAPGRAAPAAGAPVTIARARWRPVVQGLDAVALDALITGLPPIGRAEHTRERPGGADPGELVRDAVASFVDAAVRDRIARAPEPLRLLPSRPHRGGAPVVEAWLEALQSADGRVELTARSARVLAEALTGWDAYGAAPEGEARALFRLSEIRTLHDPSDPGEDPDDHTGDGTRWVCEFLLQGSEDPSLLVSAAQVWAGAADRLLDQPQELLLGELGRAARVLPGLETALRSSHPAQLDLDLEGAHRFLTRDAALLVGAGFGVQLPAGWDGTRTVGLSLSARSRAADRVVVRGGMGREELADFRWTLAVGDEELSEDEIADLVAAKAPLVRLRGRWVSVDADRLRAGLSFLAGRRRGAAPEIGEVLALAQAHPEDAPLPVTVRGEGWLGDLLAGRAAETLAGVPTPAGFRAVLRPYQERGLAWLAFLSSLGLGACLADDMGLGKTVQLLALECHDRPGRAGAPDVTDPGPTLLLCPMSLVGTWQRETEKFAPHLRVLALHGANRPRGDDLAAAIAEADLVVTTYATAARDAEHLADRTWHRLVLDEAQAVKNSRSALAAAVRRFSARHRVALTGTPVENRLGELWSIMDVLNPGLLGSREQFRNRFAVPVERHGRTETAELLRRITRPYLLRRVKTDTSIIDDLPEKIEITQHYRLTREQASLYRTIVDDMLEKIEGSDGIERRGNVLAAMAKLKQVCNHPAHLLHDGSPVGRRSGKVARLEEILAEILDAGDRVLCFTQFAEFGHMLVPHLSARFDTDVDFLHGGVPKQRRDDIVTRFQSGEGPSILLLSLKAGGTGLTLTAANHVVHLDRWWNPAVENQATDRAFRIGQKRSVQVRKFLCPGTVEERIDAMITRKRALADLVVGDGEGWLTELSTDALRELFTLGAEALGSDEGTYGGDWDDPYEPGPPSTEPHEEDLRARV